MPAVLNTGAQQGVPRDLWKSCGRPLNSQPAIFASLLNAPLSRTLSESEPQCQRRDLRLQKILVQRRKTIAGNVVLECEVVEDVGKSEDELGPLVHQWLLGGEVERRPGAFAPLRHVARCVADVVCLQLESPRQDETVVDGRLPGMVLRAGQRERPSRRAEQDRIERLDVGLKPA